MNESSEVANTDSGTEQSVLLYFALKDPQGTEAERELLLALEEELEAAIDAAGVGEFDGNEYGGHQAVLFTYGPNMNHLWETMKPIVNNSPIRPAFALLHTGEPDTEPHRIDI